MDTFKKHQKFFRGLLKNTTGNWERRLYGSAESLFTHLTTRSFSNEEMSEIEYFLSDLDLQLKTNNQKGHIQRAMNKFKAFLARRFKLVSKGYYTSMGAAMGPAMGVAFGVGIGSTLGGENQFSFGVGIGIILGFGLGFTIGAVLDNKAKKEGRLML